ncbi:MAG: excinuclease ABC subunit UvrC [Bacteroidota bacterium]
MKESEVHIKAKSLPNEPGVYQFFDKDDEIIYIGKAKDLKKRVLSYFTKKHDSNKLKLLVRSINKIERIVVETEMDALLLENNLIKKYKPKYNVLLKDDKSYPWLCIKKEPFPRVFYTRKAIRDGSEYYGPYRNVKTVITLLEIIKEIYPLRTCNYNLTSDNIKNNKFKLCLEYHLENCEGPCVGKVKYEDYEKNLKGIRGIIKGDFKHSLKRLEGKMIEFSESLEYEKAQKIKEKLDSLKDYQSRSTIVSPKISDVDVFSIISDESYAYVNFIQVSYGSIIRSHTLEIRKKLNESDKEILILSIIELRERFLSTSKEVYLPFKINLGEGIKVSVPKLGEKKSLVDLSLRNAKFYRVDKLKQIKIVDPEAHSNRIMEQAKKDLQLSVLPLHIECFDNSNLIGTNPVASCVVFKNGKPSKKDYRHFNIKGIEGPDDFASMEQVVYRRLKRLIDEKKSLPNLIIVDGGKGQLSSGMNSVIRLNLENKVAIIGIAKRLEEIFKPGDKLPLYIDKKSETLKLIQQLRNEAHRFAINFHRDKRSKAALKSEIDELKGVGPVIKEKLLDKYKSFKRLKNVKEEELIEFLGDARGRSIFKQLKN